MLPRLFDKTTTPEDIYLCLKAKLCSGKPIAEILFFDTISDEERPRTMLK